MTRRAFPHVNALPVIQPITGARRNYLAVSGVLLRSIIVEIIIIRI